MGQKLGTLWSRIQGKRQVRRICEKVFDQYAHDDMLDLDELHLVTLLVYDSINKCFPKPHKNPPCRAEIEDVVTDLRGRADGNGAIERAQFCELVLKWLQGDMKVYFRNKVMSVLASAGATAALTRSAARPVPRLRRVVDRVPISLLASAYALAFALIDDVRVDCG